MTTTAGQKLSSQELKGIDGKDELVEECRRIVLALGKLSESNSMPADLEALEHAKSHGAGSTSAIEGVDISEKKTMDNLSDAFEGLGDKRDIGAAINLESCRLRLNAVLRVCGIEGVFARRC